MVTVQNMFSPTGFIDTLDSEIVMEQELNSVIFDKKIHISRQVEKDNIKSCFCGYRGIFYCEKCGAYLCWTCDEESMCFNTLEKLKEDEEELL